MTSRPSDSALLVAGTAASVLLTEIVLTRLFSVLLFYHFSFLAVGLALFGLALGGLIAARSPIGTDRQVFERRIRTRLLGAAGSLLGVTVVLVFIPPLGHDLFAAFWLAALSAVPLVLLGEVLARTLAIGREQIHRLYALDLLASAGAALAAIPLMERIQGPLILAVPAVAALLLALRVSPPRQRLGASVIAGALVTLLIVSATAPGPLLSLRDPWPGRPVLERWDAHSRVRVFERSGGERSLVIDRTASSYIPHLPGEGPEPPRIDSLWAIRYPDPSYAFGRTVSSVAVIGVGGGQDLLPALAAGASRVDGYELNGRIVEALTHTMRSHTAIAFRPEVRLVHDEARHAIKHRSERYDVIRASLIDTWAATAAGGFVLAENGLYTVDAWRLFLDRLTPTGVLVTTRWFLPAAPAEAQRLIALAAEALAAGGMQPAHRHVVALALPSATIDQYGGGAIRTVTTIVSPSAFSAGEVTALEHFATSNGGTLLLAPGRRPAAEAATWQSLLASGTRAAQIAVSPWDIAPPTDTRPFFFLQLRPRDVFFPRPSSAKGSLGPVSAITMNGVRVLLLGVVLALLAAVSLLTLARQSRGRRSAFRSWTGRAYFAAIGIGYMAVQLALHQRLSIVLGHPTATLALVVAAMLLGTGVGSALAGHRRIRARPGTTLALPLLATVGLAAGFPFVGWLSDAPTLTWTAAAAGALSMGAGLLLGVALPTGVRVFTMGETGVAEAWAINGAFSVAGSALAALLGLMVGSHGLIMLAIPCYALAWATIVWERHVPRSMPRPAARAVIRTA